MINWSVPMIALFLAVLVAARLDARFARRIGWSKHRRVLSAALPLPLLILVGSACGVLWELLRSRDGTNMTDLAVAVYVGAGALFALIALVGGLIGASMVERKRAG